MRLAPWIALLLLLPGSAEAHVVVEPAQSEAGNWQRYTVLVPTEKSAATVRVAVKLPPGLEVVALESKPGWEGKYEPFPVGAACVQWQGGRIPAGQFLAFEFIAWNPPAPRTITWEATQWYEDGTSDRWGGAGDAQYGSTTTLRPAGGTPAPYRHGPPSK